MRPINLADLAGVPVDGMHRVVFALTHGPFPHPCHFCEEPVLGYTKPRNELSATVHHLDGDGTNNDPANLVAAHNGCHTHHHHAGKRRPHSAETREKISATLRKAYAEGRVNPPSQVGHSYYHRKIACCTKCRKELRPQDLKQHLRACWNLRWQHTAESKERIAAGKRGKPLSAAHRASISETKRGRPTHFSPEHRANLSAANKRSWAPGGKRREKLATG